MNLKLWTTLLLVSVRWFQCSQNLRKLELNATSAGSAVFHVDHHCRCNVVGNNIVLAVEVTCFTVRIVVLATNPQVATTIIAGELVL